MAEKIKGITIEIGGDTTGLDSALKGVNREISTTQSELSKVERLLKLDPSNTELLKQKQQLLSQAISDTTNKVETLKLAKQQADQQMANGTEINQEGYRALQREIASAEQTLKNSKKGYDEVSEAIKKSGQQAEESANGGFTIFKGVMANLATDAIRGVLSAIKNLGTSLLNVGKQAINSYADYEQLVGGIETLFGESSKTVQEYANNAYKTAGLSANEYMETVTSFSASLLQSLNGDTAKSAEVADMAITDMADNANKMGTSMESIQNAYQGFAKQNYTMLDNLKLGYGGTKEEMQRLLADAEKFSGVKYDISNLNDVYQAIHVVQTEMGITGTTAKEASQTIAGSVSAMQSAWSNLLAGVTDDNADMELLINNLVDSVMVAIDNILPRISQLADQFPIILANIVTKINENLPQLLQAGITILQSLISGIQQNLPQIMQAVVQIITTLSTSLIQMLPQILEMGLVIIVELAKGIAEALPELIPTIVDTMLTIVDTLLDNIDMLIDCAIDLIMALADGLIEALPILIEKAPEIIIKLVGAILELRQKLLEAGLELLKKLWEGAVEGWKLILTKVGNAVWTYVLNPIKEKVSDFMDIGKNLIEGLGQGIINAKDWLINKVKELCNNCVDSIKNFFGIQSPSKLMRDEVGVFLTRGLGEGIVNAKKYVINATEKINTAIIDELDTLNAEIRKIEESELEEQTKKEIEEHKKAIEEKYKEYEKAEKKEKQKILDEIADLEAEWNEKQKEKEVKALKEKLNTQISNIEEFKKEYESALEEIEKKETTLSDKLKNYGELFEKITEGNKVNIELNDIQEDIDIINEYSTALDRLKEKDVSESLMNEILNMDIEDAIGYTDELLKMTDEEYAKYIELWEEKQKLAEEVAKRFYETEIDNLNNEFVDKLPDELSSIKEEMTDLGKMSAQGLGDGFSGQYSYIKSKMLDTLQRAYESAKEAMDIHSPSKLYAKLGKFMADGIGIGFSEEMNNVIEEIESKLKTTVDLLQTDLGFNDVNIKGHTLVSQNENITKNYAERTEIIRQPSVIEMVVDKTKFARAIVPAIDEENVRLGVSLA